MGKINDTKELGNTLRLRRLSLNLSQKALADRCNMVYATVCAAELGREISVRNLIKICDNLGFKITLSPIE